MPHLNYPRLLEELEVLSRWWRQMAVALFVLVYLVLVVFLNLSYLRYEAPADGRRLRDLGHELVPRLPDAYFPYRDVPMLLIFACAACVVAGATRVLWCAETEAKRTPYVANMVRRFLVAYALGHVLRAMTYLPTTIPGGNDKCLDRARLAADQPTLLQCFYRTASVETNCGDEMFSGHVMLCVILVAAVREYAPRALGTRAGRALFAAAVVLLACEALSIIAARVHYTTDVVVAVYVTVMMWQLLLVYSPDLEPLAGSPLGVKSAFVASVDPEEGVGLTAAKEGSVTWGGGAQ